MAIQWSCVMNPIIEAVLRKLSNSKYTPIGRHWPHSDRSTSQTPVSVMCSTPDISYQVVVTAAVRHMRQSTLQKAATKISSFHAHPETRLCFSVGTIDKCTVLTLPQTSSVDTSFYAVEDRTPRL